MGALKRLVNQFIPKTTAGTSTAYTLSYTVAPAALVDGMTFLVAFHTTSGASPTLNPNSLGATPLHTFQGGAWAAPATGRIPSGFVSRVTYNQSAGAFRILRPLGTAADYDVGTSANNVVQLDSNGKLPAVDGSQLTNTGWETGDIRTTTRTTAATGWVMMNDGTIGDASSSATTRANADCEDLFTVLWPIAACTISGGKGASAAADWAAHKAILLPQVLGRAIAVAGAGSGLTSRVLGATVGAETHSQTGSSGAPNDFQSRGDQGGGIPVASQFHGHTITVSDGSSMQPTTFLNAEIKL
jgi:hypothetical protein